MERKILIENKNYNSEYRKRTLYFLESASEIFFTGKNREEGKKETVYLNLDVDDLLVEKFEIDNLVVWLDTFKNEKDIEVKMKDVKANSIYIDGRGKRGVKIEAKNIEKVFEIEGDIRDLVLTNFEKTLITYYRSESKPTKTERLFCKRGEILRIERGSFYEEDITIKEIRLSDIRKVYIYDLGLKEFNEFLVTGVNELITDIKIIKKLNKKSSISANTLFCVISNKKDIEILVEKYKQNLIKSNKIVFNDFSEERKESKITLKKLAEKTLSLDEISKIENIGVRRIILNYCGLKKK